MDLFKDPSWLGALAAWALAFAALGRFASFRRARLVAAFGRPETLARLGPPEAEARRSWKGALQAAGAALLFAALAGPQWGIELVTSEASGIQVLLAVDTSLSMAAEDLRPTRLEKAKSELAEILDGLKGQRVGLMAFSGRAHLICPMTTDLEAAKGLLDTLAVGLIPQTGTAVGAAINHAARLLGKYPGQKAVVLLTDGEDRKGDPLGEAKAAAEAGVRLFVIGVGSLEGGPIPLRDPAGAVTGYKKDRNGETVVTRLEEPALIRLAQAAQGAYYRATDQGTEAAAILKHLSELDRSRIQGGSANVFKNRFRFPLVLAFLVLLAELLIPEQARRGPPAGGSDRRRRAPALAAGRGAIGAALGCAIVLLSGCQAPGLFELWSGNRSYGKGDFDGAAERYAGAAARLPGDARPAFNAGAAEYKRGRFDAASEAFGAVAESGKTPKRLAPGSFYNLGNSEYRKGEYAKAAEAYKRCLLADPKDEDCRYNLVKSLHAKKNPPPKQDKQDPKKDPKDKDDKDKQGDQGPQNPKPRPNAGGMSQEDAERILQAVQEKEKAAAKQQPLQQKGVKPTPEEVDW